MGYMAHHALVVHISGYALDKPGSYFTEDSFGVTHESIAAFRESLDEQFRPLLVGPIRAAANGDYVLAFLPDGSKEGWDTSDQGDAIRALLTEMFAFKYEDGSSPFDVVEVRFGGDDPELGYALDPRRVRNRR